MNCEECKNYDIYKNSINEYKKKINNFTFKIFFEKGEDIYGYCDGYFGDSGYGSKMVFDVKKHYVVFRDIVRMKINGENYLEYDYKILTLYDLVDDGKLPENLKEMFERWKDDENLYGDECL